VLCPELHLGNASPPGKKYFFYKKSDAELMTSFAVTPGALDKGLGPTMKTTARGK
jgi:hypothetical protein